MSETLNDDSGGSALFTMRFVLPKGKTEATCSEALHEAYEKWEAQESVGHAPTWIAHDEVLKLDPVKQVKEE